MLLSCNFSRNFHKTFQENFLKSGVFLGAFHEFFLKLFKKISWQQNDATLQKKVSQNLATKFLLCSHHRPVQVYVIASSHDQ